MSDLLTSILRDLTGKLVGAIVGLALAAGVTLPADASAQLTLVISGALALACQLIYYIAVRVAEQRWPRAGKLLGAARPPTYGIDVPIHTKLVIDREASVAVALAAEKEIVARIKSAARSGRGRPR